MSGKMYVFVKHTIYVLNVFKLTVFKCFDVKFQLPEILEP